MQPWICTLLVISLITIVNCNLNCIKNENDVICSAEEDFSVLQRGTVSDDENVLLVSLANCKLTELEDAAFEELPNLETLDLSLNVLTFIQTSVFANLYNVQNLNLSYNLIGEIPAGLFDSMANLQILDLSYNKIIDLPPPTFELNNKMSKLLLPNNLLSVIPIELFDKTPEITYLSLSNNPLTSLTIGTFDNLKFLQILKLHSTQLAILEPELFLQNGELTKLYLSGNGILDIPPTFFQELQKLNHLDLSNNALTVLGENAFSSLSNLKTLNLSRNQLTDINELTLLLQLAMLDVSGNKLNTLPIFGTQTLKHMDISNNLFTNFGNNIGMYVPRKITKMILHKNPWQCACLEQLLSLLRRRKISYKTNLYFEGKKPVCVVMANKPQRCYRDSSNDEYFIKTYAEGLQKYKN